MPDLSPGSSFGRRLVERWHAPDRIAIVDVDGTGWTFGRLAASITAAASALQELSVAPGDRVALARGKGAGTLAVFFGILACGAVAVPMDPADGADALAGHVHLTGSRLVIAAPSAAGQIRIALQARGSSAAVVAIDGTGRFGDGPEAGHRPRPVPPAEDPSAPAVLLRTSGTTGPGKLVPLTHRGLLHQAEALADIWSLGPADTVLHVLPMTHAHGMLVAVLPVLWSGAKLVLRPRFDAHDVVGRLPGITCFMAVPVHYAELARHPALDRRCAASVRLFICGSAPLPPAVRTAFETKTGHRILERYGLSETLLLTAERPDSDTAAPSVGPPLPGVELRLADPVTGVPGVDGPVGEVQVRGPNVLEAYWNQPERTTAAFTSDGWFRTGDVGRLTTDGRLVLSGRCKDIIIYAGMNIHPPDVEAPLATLPGVAEVCVFGVPHPTYGEAVVAVVAPHPGNRPSPGALRQALAGLLPPRMVPKRILLVDGLPRNPMGKVAAAELRRRYAALFAGPRQSDRPSEAVPAGDVD